MLTLHLPRKGMETITGVPHKLATGMLTLHLPRKGMETFVLLPATEAFTAQLTLHLPRKGMETPPFRGLSNQRSQVDITSSPQGDGNIIFC